MNIFEERAKAADTLKALIGKLKSGEDCQDEVAEATRKVEELNEKCALAAKSKNVIDALGTVRKQGDAGAEEGAKSIGEHFVNTVLADMKANASSRSMSVTAPEYKAASDVHVSVNEPGKLTPGMVDTNIVRPYDYQLTIADWLGSATLQEKTLTYFIEDLLTGKEGGFATVDENGKKPAIHYGGYKEVTETLRKIAGYIKVSTEMIDDQEFLVSELNNRLLLDLKIFEEDQLLNGDGSSTNLKGLLNRDGVQVATAENIQATPDAIFRASTKIRNATGLAVDGVVMNPEDYENIRLLKDENGQYFAGGFFYGQYGSQAYGENPPLWGKRVIVTPAIKKGTVLLGAGKAAATVYRKGGITMSTAFQNEDDFVHNRATILAEERLLLAVRRPAAFCKLTITG